MESSITAGSTAPKIRRNNGRQKISPPAVIVKEITITVRKICLAALFALLLDERLGFLTGADILMDGGVVASGASGLSK